MDKAELLKLLKGIKLDLEMRGGKDSDGVRFVELSSFLWEGLNDAIEKLEAEVE